jgi:hypothetical protein
VALIERFEAIPKARESIHEPVDCGYAVIDVGGTRLLQIETYGRKSRKLKGKVSQTVQFTREAAIELKRIIERAFSSH